MGFTIGIWGDSITEGACDYSGGGWANRIRRKLLQNTNEHRMQIHCLGISGEATNELLERFETEAKPRKCNMIIFAIGINDSCYLKEPKNKLVPMERFEKNLDKLYQTAIKLGTERVSFVGLNLVEETLTTPLPVSTQGKCYTNALIKQYDQALRIFCIANELDYIEIIDDISLEDLNDGLHPNEDGHEKISNIVYNYLQNI